MRTLERLGAELHGAGAITTPGSVEHDFPLITKIVESMDDDERNMVRSTAHVVELIQRDPARFWEGARKTLLDKIGEEEEARKERVSGTRRKVPITVVGEESA
jgi:hypothetical protein